MNRSCGLTKTRARTTAQLTGLAALKKKYHIERRQQNYGAQYRKKKVWDRVEESPNHSTPELEKTSFTGK